MHFSIRRDSQKAGWCSHSGIDQKKMLLPQKNTSVCPVQTEAATVQQPESEVDRSQWNPAFLKPVMSASVGRRREPHPCYAWAFVKTFKHMLSHMCASSRVCAGPRAQPLLHRSPLLLQQEVCASAGTRNGRHGEQWSVLHIELACHGAYSEQWQRWMTTVGARSGLTDSPWKQTADVCVHRQSCI